MLKKQGVNCPAVHVAKTGQFLYIDYNKQNLLILAYFLYSLIAVKSSRLYVRKFVT